MKEGIQLINHASVFLNLSKDFCLLSDPWYEGLAFDNGWSLLYENEEEFILEILNKTNHIFISHEHPDHFSISFFKKYSQFLKDNKIKIIFQKTLDKRVENFLSKKLNLELIILEPYITKEIAGQRITMIDCGTIDSSLLIETDKSYHLNLNDCDFTNSQLSRIKKFFQKDKKIIIYMQFSYAAYRSNDDWLKKASEYKLKRLLEIYKFFNADLLVPFASFIYFSSAENFRMNKFMNNVQSTSNFLQKKNISYCIFNPNEKEVHIQELIKDQDLRNSINLNSINFWDEKFKNIKPLKSKIEIVNIHKNLIKDFLQRVKEKNSIFLMYLIRWISFKYFFGDTIIHLQDKNETYILNFFNILKKDKVLPNKIDIEMNSSRFNFLLKEKYGLDTLTVNGCFNSVKKNGFENLIRSIGFVVFNQVDRGIIISDILSNKIINRIGDIFLRLIKKNS